MPTGHLYLYLSIYLSIYPLEKCLFSSANFSAGLFVFVIELYKVFVYFADYPLVSCIIWKYFLPFCMLSFCFLMVFFAVQKLLHLIRSHLFTLFLFLLSCETDLRKHRYYLCQRIFYLCYLLEVLWCHVLSLSR